MKVIREVIEDENEGFKKLMGEEVMLWCAIYIYAGKLVGVNETCVKLANPHVVYETGPLAEPGFQDAQALPGEHHYVRLDMIESFGPVA